MTTTHVTQWRGSDDNWYESIGADSSGANQQRYWARKAGIEDFLSLEGAAQFAIVLLDAISYGPENVRIVKRTETVISDWHDTQPGS